MLCTLLGVKWIATIIPVFGIALAAGVPLLRYTMRDRDERVAIDVVRQLTEAQRTFRARAEGYATDLDSLTIGCEGVAPALRPDALSRLEAAGYMLQLRAAVDASFTAAHCDGRRLASDYYVAAVPASASAPARQGIAARSDGRLFLFHDGIAPSEADIATGLPTPVEERDAFKIP